MKPVPCDICENTAAKYHCNNCGDALCPQCKVHHLKSRGTKHHQIVPYAEKLNPKYITGLLCPKHQTHAPKFWCKTCGVPICDSCVITNEHGGHELSDITAILSEKRDEMLAEMKSLRDTTVGEWEEVLKKAQGITTDFLGNIDDMEKELVSRAKEMHREVEAILSKSQQDLQKIKLDGLAKLKSQEKILEDRLCQLKADVERYEDQLRDADPNALIQFTPNTGQLKDKTKPPVLEKLSTPVFAKGQNDTDAMQKIFGQLSTKAFPQKSKDVDKKSSRHSSPEPAATSDLKKTMVPSSATNVTHRSLIPKPSVQYNFLVEHSYPRIACVEQGLAWVQTGKYMLQLVNRDGLVMDTINIDFNISDMVVTSDGELLLADISNKCIKLVSRQKTISTLFTTSGKPCGLCCFPNKDIVVTFADENKVIVYSRDGQLRQKLDNLKFRYPRKLAVNKVNQDIYICDTGKVIAVGADGQLKYEYIGQCGSLFSLCDVCTDQMGHVLIIDHNNHRVHMLDQDGQFIQYILTEQKGLSKPVTIDVDNEGYVWVGEDGYSRGRVKVARYLQ